MKTPGCFAAIAFISVVGNATAGIIYFEDFNSGDGGYTVTNGGNPVGPWTWDGVGSWYTNGTDNNGAPSSSDLISPNFVVSANGAVEIIFSHRYSFEYDGNTRWDGGAVFVSVNQGAFTQLADAAFSANGYTGIITGNNLLNGRSAYNGTSNGYGSGDFITSSASLGTFTTGDSIRLQFRGAWDEFVKGSEPNWQIDWVEVQDASGVPTPATLGLMGLGLVGIGYQRRKQIKAA